MQEDQLYAMDDYLAQYQQLICKYREENAALRRQLAAEGRTPTTAPTTTPRTRIGTPPTTNGPDIDIPETPGTNGTPSQPLEVPDVPPLGETTSVDLHEIQRRQVKDVLLRGEVVENDDGGGPRLIIDVEPRDAAGRPAKFDGGLSLMLVEPNGDDGRQKLARWDYRPNDVQSAIDPASGVRIRFQVELPSDTPVPESSELWVQLMPRKGGRLVTHADIDLQQPSTFASSNIESPAPHDLQDRAVITAVYHEATPVPPVESEILDAGWSIARPNEPAGIPNGSDSDEWRASLEPPPEAIAMPRPMTSSKRQSKSPTEDRAITSNRPKSAWSPDRSGNASAAVPNTAARPSWSATR